MNDLPLTESHRRDIEASLQQLSDLDEVIIRASQAGLDVTTQKAKVKDVRTKLKKIKAAFFPNQ